MAPMGISEQLSLTFVRDCSWVPGVFKNVSHGNFVCSSDRTNNRPHNGYNCIAHAAGKSDNWWWPIDDPSAFWPIPLDPIDPVTVKEFIKAFATENYVTCNSGRFEDGYEKIAIYVDGNGEPTHAARQLPDGRWTSKLGKYEDIEHKTPECVENQVYGKVKLFLKRQNPLCKRLSKRKIFLSFLKRIFGQVVHS